MVVCCNKNAEQYYITHCETGLDRLDKISLSLWNFVLSLSSGVPSQNSRHHACMVCMVIPPKRGLEYL